MLGKSIQIVTAAQHRLLQHRSRIPGVEDLFRRATLLREEEEEEEGLFKANAVQSTRVITVTSQYTGVVCCSATIFFIRE